MACGEIIFCYDVKLKLSGNLTLSELILILKNITQTQQLLTYVLYWFASSI